MWVILLCSPQMTNCIVFHCHEICCFLACVMFIGFLKNKYKKNYNKQNKQTRHPRTPVSKSQQCSAVIKKVHKHKTENKSFLKGKY